MHLKWGHFPLYHLGKGMWQRALHLLGTGQEHCLTPNNAKKGSSSGEILPQLGFLRFCGLNENDPHRLPYLNTWSPVGCDIWGDLGGVALLEEVWQTSLQVKLPLADPAESLRHRWSWLWCLSTATEGEGKQGGRQI